MSFLKRFQIDSKPCRHLCVMRKEVTRSDRHMPPFERNIQVAFLIEWHNLFGNLNPENNKMKESSMMETILALCIAALLGVIPGTPLVKESLAHPEFIDAVNGFCPSQPLTSTSCDSCHNDPAARAAILASDYCFFCPSDPPCVGGPCAGSAQASVTGNTRENGPSRLRSDLAYFLLPVGAVIGLRIWRRKR
jgi:hypothetical protein